MKRIIATTAATLVIAGSLVSPVHAQETTIDDVKNLSCDDFKMSLAGMVALTYEGKTRNELYNAYLPMLQQSGNNAAQSRRGAAAYADKAAECRIVAFPFTQRLTTFLLSSKAAHSSISA